MSSIILPSARWEEELFDLASAAFEGERVYTSYEMERSYACAGELTREHSKSFYLASGLLPADKRRAVRALYAFCRVTDDLVDENDGSDGAKLEQWRNHALAAHPPAGDPLLLAWHDARLRHRIPIGLVRQLIDGIAVDLVKTRYETFEELTRYCYGVASTVGLMAMQIIGYSDPQATRYAVKLGVALQLTNILRDIGEDLGRDRIYLPQEDLRTFGYREEDLFNGIVDERFRSLMDFEIARTRTLYDEAWEGIALLAEDGRLAIAAAAEFYRAILAKIPKNGYDVFNRRAHLSAGEKLIRLPRLWLGVVAM